MTPLIIVIIGTIFLSVALASVSVALIYENSRHRKRFDTALLWTIIPALLAHGWGFFLLFSNLVLMK